MLAHHQALGLTGVLLVYMSGVPITHGLNTAGIVVVHLKSGEVLLEDSVDQCVAMYVHVKACACWRDSPNAHATTCIKDLMNT